MEKPRDHEENLFDHEGNFDLERTIDERENTVRYVAPGAEQKWRARDLLDIHWEHTGLGCPASYNRIMSCIVGHANPNNGVCNPKQAVIAIETGYSDRTVRRAIDWWIEHGFLRTEVRGHSIALAYHPQWDLFETHWKVIASGIEADKEELRDRMTRYPRECPFGPTGQPLSAPPGQQLSAPPGHMLSAHESQSMNLKVEPHPNKGGRSRKVERPQKKESLQQMKGPAG
jgi:Helix-turn-helix domain